MRKYICDSAQDITLYKFEEYLSLLESIHVKLAHLRITRISIVGVPVSWGEYVFTLSLGAPTTIRFDSRDGWDIMSEMEKKNICVVG